MLIVPAENWVKLLKMALETHVRSLPGALGHATPSKNLPGACGVSYSKLGFGRIGADDWSMSTSTSRDVSMSTKSSEYENFLGYRVGPCKYEFRVIESSRFACKKCYY